MNLNRSVEVDFRRNSIINVKAKNCHHNFRVPFIIKCGIERTVYLKFDDLHLNLKSISSEPGSDLKVFMPILMLIGRK